LFGLVWVDDGVCFVDYYWFVCVDVDVGFLVYYLVVEWLGGLFEVYFVFRVDGVVVVF